MKITRANPFTGVETTRDLDVTDEQIELYMSGTLLQDAFPQLGAADREWLKTGICEQSWNEMFGEDA